MYGKRIVNACERICATGWCGEDGVSEIIVSAAPYIGTFK